MILLIDNYDSFTYNLVHLVESCGISVKVVRNDAATVAEIRSMRPQGIVISPGPGKPRDAGITLEIIRELGADTPILGVCLGHQAIGEACGALVARHRESVHGKSCLVRHDGSDIFRGIDNPFPAGRYHSLEVVRGSIPGSLTITAEADDGTIMGLRHSDRPLRGVQFHPESILTPAGQLLMSNWVSTL